MGTEFLKALEEIEGKMSFSCEHWAKVCKSKMWINMEQKIKHGDKTTFDIATTITHLKHCHAGQVSRPY